MATLKLKPPRTTPASPARAPTTDRTAPAAPRAPVRGAGSGVKKRPTLAEAQAQRAEREARYQEQLRQRYGDRPPPGPRLAPDERPPQRAARPDQARRSEPARSRERPPEPHADRRPERLATNTAFGQRPPPPDWRPIDEPPAIVPRPPKRNDGSTRQERADDRRLARPPARDAPRDAAGDARDARGVPREVRRDVRRDVRLDARSDATREVPRDVPRDIPRDISQVGQRGMQRGARRDEPFTDPMAHTPGSMRLSKRMSELGIASRREADEWIAAGWVRVDGQVVKELGSRVVAAQQVTVDAKARHQQSQRVTVLINKPVGYVSGQAEDGYEPAVVLVTPQNQWREDHSGTRFLREHTRSLVPAGRLDIDSVGLLVLTQDGRVAKQLVGEDSEIEKEYLVRVEVPAGGRLSDEGLALLNHGLELDGEALRPARVEWVNDDQLRFVLKQGKKRQIRRMCEAVGLKVVGLKRVRIGAVMLGDLPAGQWRYLKVGETFA